MNRDTLFGLHKELGSHKLNYIFVMFFLRSLQKVILIRTGLKTSLTTMTFTLLTDNIGVGFGLTVDGWTIRTAKGTWFYVGKSLSKLLLMDAKKDG